MGNSQSNDVVSSSSNLGHTPHSTNDHHRGEGSNQTQSHRTGSHGHSHGNPSRDAVRKAPPSTPFRSLPAPPTAHIINSSTGAASTSTSTEHAHATVTSASPNHTRSRPRSVTLGTPKSGPIEPTPSHKSDPPTMGNENSRQARSGSRPEQRSAPVDIIPPTQSSSPTDATPRPLSSPHPQPVDVPLATNIDGSSQRADVTPGGYSESPYGLPPSNFSRPPRLPLPIEEEIYTPGSPIITPQDISESLQKHDLYGAVLSSSASVLSSNADEDEDNDYESFVAESSRSLQARIPTTLEWNHPAQKVFVTGTFCAWDKKIKLHRKHNAPGFSAELPLPPGTHHLKFLVDNEMMTNPDMPTTVDWSNILVNYFEVAPPKSAGPIPIPGAVATPDKVPSPKDASPKTVAPAQQIPKTALPVRERPTNKAEQAKTVEQEEEQTRKNNTIKGVPIPRAKYTNEIPEFLIDLDRYNNPEDPRFQRASRVLSSLPQPPTLPLFLGKSILNGATPQKDDASVLIIPNHTVINHLATSSIKGGVLAISATTRYKRKFLTTIMYKPSTSDG